MNRKPGRSRVSWRDGVHLVGTPIWCDASLLRQVCFVSSADAAGTAKHHQMIATEGTHTLLNAIAGKDKNSALSTPLGRPFTLGSHRLELFASGVGMGAASLVADVGESRIVYAGSINTQPSPTAQTSDVRTCDTLIIDGEYADEHYIFPSFDEAADLTAKHCNAVTREGGVSILLVRTVTKAIDVAIALANRGLDLSAHRSFFTVMKQLGETLGLKRIRRATNTPKPGTTILWPLKARSTLNRISVPEKSQITLLSGRAKDSSFVEALEIDGAIAWSQKADSKQLAQYINTTGASDVHFLGSRETSSWKQIRGTGANVFPLGPPRQMSLF